MTALRESPIFNEIFKEGLEAGMAKGREVGLTEGRKQMALNNLLLIVESRFGPVGGEIQALLAPLTAEQLQMLLKAALSTASWEDFREEVRHIHPLNGDSTQ